MTEPSAIILPFGKHKGKTVAEVIEADPQYVDWVTTQGWLADRFAEIHKAFITRGAGTDDTPDHNSLQVLFLKEDFQIAVLMAAEKIGMPKRPNNYELTFEHLGTDVFYCLGTKTVAYSKPSRNVSYGLGVEIKPSLGDDYPSTMRQMSALSTSSPNCQILLIQEYAGKGATFDDVRSMFLMNKCYLIMLSEVQKLLKAAQKSIKFYAGLRDASIEAIPENGIGDRHVFKFSYLKKLYWAYSSYNGILMIFDDEDQASHSVFGYDENAIYEAKI